jgi:hypothetical protein
VSSTLLDRLHRLAVPLHRARILLWILGAAGAGVFAASVLGVVDGENVPLVSFMFALWAAFLIAFAGCFRTPPPRVNSRAGFGLRIRTRLIRGLLWTIAIACVGLFGFVAFLSVRTAGMLIHAS